MLRKLLVVQVAVVELLVQNLEVVKKQITNLMADLAVEAVDSTVVVLLMAVLVLIMVVVEDLVSSVSLMVLLLQF